MTRGRNPVSVFVSLLVTTVLCPTSVQCSEVNQVYALPPSSMIYEHPNASAATVQDVHVVKPPEILLRNTLLRKDNASLQDQPILPTTRPTSGSPTGVPEEEGHGFHAYNSPPSSSLVPFHGAHTPPPLPPLIPGNFSSHPFSQSNHNLRFPVNPPSFPPPPPHGHIKNGTSIPKFQPRADPFGPFSEVDRFVNFVPMDYENGQMPGFVPPPHQKREAPRANRRAGQGPPPPQRRNSTSPLKSIISSFHEKFSRMFLGPRRFGPNKQMRQQAGKSQQGSGRNVNERVFDPAGIEDARTFELELPQAPSSANDHTFAAALNTVAQILKENQYIPMLGKRERVRTLSREESQNLDSFRRRDRGRRRPPPRRRYPRKRRPFGRPPYDEEDSPPKYYRDREPPYHDEEDYYSKPKYNRFPKHFHEDDAPHKDHGPPYKGFKSFKSFKPWKPNFESFEDHEEAYRQEGHHHGRKPPWHIDSHEKGSFNNPNHHLPSHYTRPHHHDKYKEFSGVPDGALDTEGFKPIIKPYYGGSGKFKDWDEKKMKFHKVIDYDAGTVGVSHFSNFKQGQGVPSYTVSKDEDSRIPKIIINHHHNLPPASTGASFIPGAYPANSVVSYTPPIHHFHDDFFAGPRGRGRGKKEYRSNEFADSFIVNDYGKPPMPAFGLPPPAPVGYPPHPPMHGGGGPPPGVAASPPMGGHMVFDHFAQNMPSHFMNGKLPAAPHLNQAPFVGPPAGHHQHPMSYANSHFARPMIPGGHYPNQVTPGFPPMGQHPESADPFGKPIASQMASYNDMPHHEEFPQSRPPLGFHNDNDHIRGGGGPGSHELPPGPPPSDSSPFPSSNEHQDPDVNGFLPPFTPVPTKNDAVPPTQGPSNPGSRETFFSMKPPRKKVPRKFEFKIVKTLSSGFEIPEKLTNHPLAEPKPTPIMNYFDLGVPDREHYKKKKQRQQSQNSHQSNENRGNRHSSSSREDQSHRQSSLPSLGKNKNRYDSNEFNYSTLPENWNSFRPDPSHKRLPSLTHPPTETPEIGSRMHKFRSSLNPKNLVNAIISRFPGGARRVDKVSRGMTKFTPYDAKSREHTMMGASNRKRRKSTKAPASIQDIIDSDSSNHNKEIVVSLSDDELNNDSAQNDHHEGGASQASPVISKRKGLVLDASIKQTSNKKPSKKSRSTAGEDLKQQTQQHISNEIQTEMPFNGELDDDVLLGIHNINIPLSTQIRMSEKKKKK